MKPPAARIRLSLVSLLFLVAGCAALGPGRPRGLADQPDRVNEIVAALGQRAARLRSYRGLAEIRYGNRLLGPSSDAALFVRFPSALRIDGLSPFGTYDYQLMLVRGELAIYWGGTHQYLKTLATPDLLAEYLSISVEPEVAAGLLAGLVPLEAPEDYRIAVRDGDRLILRGRSTQIELESREGTYLPIQAVGIDVDGSFDYRIRYSRWSWKDGLPFPGMVEGRFWNPKAEIRVEYLEADLNPALDAEAFEIRIPEDARPL